MSIIINTYTMFVMLGTLPYVVHIFVQPFEVGMIPIFVGLETGTHGLSNLPKVSGREN